MKFTRQSALQFALLLLISLALQFCKSTQVTSSTQAAENPVSYRADLLPIMQQKCTPCHFPERGQKKMLDTYTATRENIDDILRRVQLPVTDEDFMPFKSKREPLTEAEIRKFKVWVAQSMPE